MALNEYKYLITFANGRNVWSKTATPARKAELSKQFNSPVKKVKNYGLKRDPKVVAKAARAKERKYTSKEDHEQKYKAIRKSKIETYKKALKETDDIPKFWVGAVIQGGMAAYGAWSSLTPEQKPKAKKLFWQLAKTTTNPRKQFKILKSDEAKELFASMTPEQKQQLIQAAATKGKSKGMASKSAGKSFMKSKSSFGTGGKAWDKEHTSALGAVTMQVGKHPDLDKYYLKKGTKNKPKYFIDTNSLKKLSRNELIELSKKIQPAALSKDLFFDEQKMPKEVAALIDAYADNYDDNDYMDTHKLHDNIEKLGYTFEYGLDNQPYGLRKIGIPITQVLDEYDDPYDFATGGRTKFDSSTINAPVTPKEREMAQKDLIPLSNNDLDRSVKQNRYGKLVTARLKDLGLSGETAMYSWHADSQTGVLQFIDNNKVYEISNNLLFMVDNKSELIKLSKFMYNDPYELEAGGKTELKWIIYKDKEIMHEPVASEYYTNDKMFKTLAAAKQYIDKGSPEDAATINAYRHGAFATGGKMETGGKVNLDNWFVNLPLDTQLEITGLKKGYNLEATWHDLENEFYRYPDQKRKDIYTKYKDVKSQNSFKAGGVIKTGSVFKSPEGHQIKFTAVNSKKGTASSKFLFSFSPNKWDQGGSDTIANWNKLLEKDKFKPIAAFDCGGDLDTLKIGPDHDKYSLGGITHNSELDSVKGINNISRTINGVNYSYANVRSSQKDALQAKKMLESYGNVATILTENDIIAVYWHNTKSKGGYFEKGGCAVPTQVYNPTNSLGIPRIEMPQITPDQEQDFEEYLSENNVKLEKETIPAQCLKPVQREINIKKVDNMPTHIADKFPVIASSDDYILDGHHRWYKAVLNDLSMPILKASVPIKTLLSLAYGFDGVSYQTLKKGGKLSSGLTKAKKEVYERISTVTGPDNVSIIEFTLNSGESSFDDIILQNDLTQNEAAELNKYAASLK
jgi:hypothetical protein